MVHFLNTDFSSAHGKQDREEAGDHPRKKVVPFVPSNAETAGTFPTLYLDDCSGMLPSYPRLRSIASEKRATRDFGIFSSQTSSWPAAALTQPTRGTSTLSARSNVALRSS